MILGTDFDNTVVEYGHLFPQAVAALGIPFSGRLSDKRTLRHHLRSLPKGEILWQKVQAEVYGVRMPEARLLDGFSVVVQQCRQLHVPLFIVSHKTRFAAQGQALDLRAGALAWMQDQGFFDAERMGLTPDQVFFEETRTEKLARIGSLGCTHFVDDLEEVLLHPAFPSATARIWFSQEEGTQGIQGSLLQAATWADIGRLLFG